MVYIAILKRNGNPIKLPQIEKDDRLRIIAQEGTLVPADILSTDKNRIEVKVLRDDEWCNMRIIYNIFEPLAHKEGKAIVLSNDDETMKMLGITKETVIDKYLTIAPWKPGKKPRPSSAPKANDDKALTAEQKRDLVMDKVGDMLKSEKKGASPRRLSGGIVFAAERADSMETFGDRIFHQLKNCGFKKKQCTELAECLKDEYPILHKQGGHEQ